ncbi:unnamed protein product [Sympodiomycopsis kandeliae]
MLVSEPSVLATSIFHGLNYMIIYGFILSFELVYGKSYGWSVGNSNLPFLAAIVGACLGFAAVPIQRAYERLFWFAWTAVPNIHWISIVLSKIMFGKSHILYL